MAGQAQAGPVEALALGQVGRADDDDGSVGPAGCLHRCCLQRLGVQGRHDAEAQRQRSLAVSGRPELDPDLDLPVRPQVKPGPDLTGPGHRLDRVVGNRRRPVCDHLAVDRDRQVPDPGRSEQMRSCRPRAGTACAARSGRSRPSRCRAGRRPTRPAPSTSGARPAADVRSASRNSRRRPGSPVTGSRSEPGAGSGTVTQIWPPSATVTSAVPASRPASAAAGVDRAAGATTALPPPWIVGRTAPGPTTASREMSCSRSGRTPPGLLSRTRDAAVARRTRAGSMSRTGGWLWPSAWPGAVQPPVVPRPGGPGRAAGSPCRPARPR